MEYQSPGGAKLKQTRVAILATTLVVAAVTAHYVLKGAGTSGSDQPGTTRIAWTDHVVPRLVNWSTPQVAETGGTAAYRRDPFAEWVAKVDQTVQPPRPCPPVATVAEDSPSARTGKESEPGFDLDYLGYLGPKRLRVAVFRKDSRVEVATVGEVVDGTFLIRSIGRESVDIGVVGRPETDLTTVWLTDD